MADSNTKYTFVLEAIRADGKLVRRFTNKPDNRAQVLINNGYKPKDEHSKVHQNECTDDKIGICRFIKGYCCSRCLN